jgi:translation initiation factor 3 subunit L
LTFAYPFHREHYEAGSEQPLDFESLTVVQRLGYFSLFGLLRLNCMLGDYYAALKSIQCVDFHRRAPLFYRIDALHLTVQSYQAFCMLMVRKYGGAVRVLSRTLGFLLRARAQRSDETLRRIDKMFKLLALCVVLSGTKAEDTVDRQLREKMGNKLALMGQGHIDTYLELFQTACTKFINPSAAGTAPQDAMLKRQTALFRSQVEQQSKLPELRSFLNLYTTVSIEKLASNMKVGVEDVVAGLLALRQSSLAHSNGEGCSDVPVSIEEVGPWHGVVWLCV